MKVEVSKINDTGLRLEEDIPAQDWDMDSEDVKFTGNIHLDCTFRRITKEIIVDTRATTARLIICSRCLSQVTQTITQDFKLNYNTASLGNHLEIDKDIREEILLNFPMKVLCVEDCKGICKKCGANLNHEDCKCYQNIKTKKQD